MSHRTILAHSNSQLGRLLVLEGRHAEAFDRLSDAMRGHAKIGDAWGLAMDFDAMCGLTMARGRTADTIRLIGAVDGLRERVAIGLPATEQAQRDEIIAAGRRELGAAYESTYEEGRRLSIEHAVQIALDAGGAKTAEHQAPAPTTSLGLSSAPTAAIDAPPRSTMSVLALGPLQVYVDGEPVESAAWGSVRPRELLVYLLMHPEGRTKEQVGLVFWPEASSAQLRNSFHVTLHRLRKALRNPEWITASNDRYRIAPDALGEFDVAIFERDVALARRALMREDAGAGALLERALSSYRGDFLDGEPAGDWHLEHHDRLQRMFIDGLMDLGAHLSSERRHARAAEVYRRVLARDDVHEDAALALMRSHALLGERSQAMRLHQKFARRLRAELDAEPSEEMIELYESLK